MQFFLLWLGLTIGNFVFEALTRRNWSRALERSYFQGIAVLGAFWIAS